MFTAKTTRIKELAERFPGRIQELENIFDKKTNVYIDLANVLHWQEQLEYHIDFKRVKQLLDSFSTVSNVKIYQGKLDNDEKSEKLIDDLQSYGYILRTKPVKKMYLSIDVSSIEKDNPSILKNLINKSLLGKLDIDTVKFLNGKLSELNSKGIKAIKHLKCNFDVEIASDMLIDNMKDNTIENFVLWSGDSDFSDTLSQLHEKGKQIMLFSTARRVSRELSDLNSCYIFELKKIKDFICWPKELVSPAPLIELIESA